MKTIKSLVLVAIMAVSTVVSASNPTSTERSKAENAKITAEISNYLQNPRITINEPVVTHAMVALNADNELVVLSVATDNESIKAYIKSRLNYKKIACNYKGSDNLFKVPVRIMPNE